MRTSINAGFAYAFRPPTAGLLPHRAIAKCENIRSVTIEVNVAPECTASGRDLRHFVLAVDAQVHHHRLDRQSLRRFPQ